MEQQLAFPQRQRTSQTGRFAAYKAKIFAFFFATDKSPDNHVIVDIQRRACWISLALILQALNEINPGWYTPYVPFMQAWTGLISFLLILGSFCMMGMAFYPMTLKRQTRRVAKHPYRWQRIVLVLALITSLAGVAELGLSVYLGFFHAPTYTNDGTSLDTNAAIVLLEGHDPYVDSDLAHIVRLFSLDPGWTTPLREGQFANQVVYPSPEDLRTVLDTDLKSGNTPEFESKVSYPSLSFLTLVPFVWLGITNVLPFYLLCYLALILIGWSVARKELRPWIIVLALTNVSMWTSVAGGNLDVLTILLLVLAWLGRNQRWRSALLVGLALACKQPAWFFLPFYAILICRTYNWQEAARRLLIAGAIALALNLPFILWNAPVWVAGIMAPVVDPMFPTGVGLVGLVGLPFLQSYLPNFMYSVFEVLTLFFCLAWYWRLCKTHPEAAMLLAVLPLFLAWRSLSSYFYCSAFPMFLLLAARGNTGKGSQSKKNPFFGAPTHLVDPVSAEQTDEITSPERVLVPAGGVAETASVFSPTRWLPTLSTTNAASSYG
jgi:uncharacterized membrane protein